MNEGTWDLSVFYQDFDDPALRGDIDAIRAAAEGMENLLAQDRPESDRLEAMVSCLEDMTNRLTRAYGYAELTLAADTENEGALRLMDELSALMVEVQLCQSRCVRHVGGVSGLDQLIEGREALRENGFILREMARQSAHMLPAELEKWMLRMSLDGGDAFSKLRDRLIGTHTVDLDGKAQPLPAVRGMAYDPDPAVRKAAYEAELACYDKIKDSVAFALNSIKLQVINECQVRGYASPLDKALYQSRMKRETLEALLGAMDEYMPKFWQYLRAKAKALGYENGLPWYELFAPMGKSDKKYTTQDAKDYLLNIFGGFDSQLHDMVERAFDEAWIDFYPRDGKVGGAFDCGVPSARQSRVLTNFDGAFGDIVTLAHELGHAFHDQQVFTHPLICQEYSMPVAETASTFNEVLTVTAAIQAAQDKDEKLALIESQLSDACQIICDIYSRFLFESSVFEARPQEFLDADRLCQLMLEAQKKAYGDGLDQTCLHPYMWLCKGHYYSGSLSFYNFPYAFGGLFARGLYAKYQQEGEKFVPLYKEMLHATSVNDVEDTAKIAGIDLTDKAFWRQGLQSLADEIDLFCDLVK